MSDRQTVKKAKQRLLDAMAQVHPCSNEYTVLSQQLERLTKSEANEKGWRAGLGVGLAQTAISTVTSTIQIMGILKHEDRGNIVKTESTKYIQKPVVNNLYNNITPKK